MPSRSAQAMIEMIDEIQRLRGRLISALIDVRAPTGLSSSEITVLSAAVNATQPPTVPQIGRSLGHPRQVIQRLADNLAERGLVIFVDNPDHRRAKRLLATECGKAVHAAAQERALAWAEQFVAGIDCRRLDETVEMLRDLRTRLQHADNVAATVSAAGQVT